MYILVWLIFGAFVGWIASILTNKNKRMGTIANIIVGLIGSIIGGWIASQLGLGSYNTYSIAGMLIAVGGAVLLLTVINLFKSNRH